jgi:hypothetical protein
MKSDSANQPVIPHEGVHSDLPLVREIIFTNHKNAYSKRIEKRQKKLLKKIPLLKNFLREDEKILLVTTGCSPASLLEQMLTGWIFIYLKRALFVFTDKRVFHIPTKKNYSYRDSIAHILYSDCNSIQMKGRKLVAEYKNGKKEKFLYIPRKEKRKIKAVLPAISFEGSPSRSQKRTHLCPRCTKELEEGNYICANCRLQFKEPGEAKKISIIYPGGGYFFTRHPFLGIGDAIVETIFLVLVIMSLIDVTHGVQEGGVNFLSLAVFLGIEKAISVYHSDHFIKEYIPKERDIQPQPIA